ncbi:hypothetical protein [Paraburkholderia sp. DGU8]|uniref:hypothetical protein n=1 Tax=Paraburkholderia sp. DGU8 TaxID=3161997 RepID=UPI003467911B
MLSNFGKPDPLSQSHADRIREAVRANFELGTDIVIMVSEVECQAPGCPPLETVVAFWTGEGRHRFKVFKPMSAFDDDDLPWKWLRRSLMVPEDYVDGCC